MTIRTKDSDDHNKKIVAQLLKKFERLAKKGKMKKGTNSTTIIPGTAVVVSCQRNKVAISWPQTLRYAFLIDHIESLGYVPGKNDLQRSLFDKGMTMRQFKKEL